MTVLRPTPVSTDKFTYNASERSFFAELSDLQINFSRVYDDAVDEGFTMVSARTGKEIVFVVEHIEFDPEGDLRWWTLRSLTGDFIATVFND